MRHGAALGVGLLLAGMATAPAVGQPRPATHGPDASGVLGVSLGRTLVPKLTRRFGGPGRVSIGGHSDSFHTWTFRDGLELGIDGFDRIGNALIVDYIGIQGWRGRLGDTREGRRWGAGAYVGLRCGASRHEVTKALAGLGPPTHRTHRDLHWRASIHVRGHRQRFRSETICDFRNDRLYRVRLLQQ